MRRFRVFVALALVGAMVSEGRGDIVHLRDGQTLEGTVEEHAQTVRVTTPAGTVTLKRDEIDRIEKTRSPAEIYREKLAALPENDADAAYDLALWCRDQGLRDEHDALLARALAINPNHPGALAERRRALVYAPLPRRPDRVASLESEFGERLTVKETAHYLVAYNCEESFAGGRIALLERLFSAFYGYFQEGDFPLMPLKERLGVVIFGSRQEFVDYSRAHIPAAAQASGYYRLDSNRCVFFATHTEEEYRRLREAADQVRRLIAADADVLPRLRRDLGEARRRGDREAADRIQRALEGAEKQRADLDRIDQALTSLENARAMVVLHEATHQLVFNTGLLRNPAGDPRWLHEGFAMLFESARAGKWRGLATPNVERLQQYRRYQEAGRLPALKDVLTQQEPFLRVGPETLPHYASAWALLYYLAHRRRADLNDYLRLVVRRQPGPVSAEARLKDFTDAFGTDLAALETDWRAFISRVEE